MLQWFTYIVAGLIVVGLVVGLVIYSNHAAARARREAVYRKYGHTEDAARIIARSIWQGETAEQLRDSLGRPIDVDQKVLKTKTKEVWKYSQTGVNRFGLRVTLENGVVVGWEKK